jgi:hypothetical protein
MSSPVQLSDLPVASSAANNDTTLLRKGLTDYQCAIEIIRTIDLTALSPIPGGFSIATDLLMTSRTIGGNPQNFQLQFSQVGFVQGTKMWFYQGAAPTGWTIIPDTGDRLLGVTSGSSTKNKYAGTFLAGTQSPLTSWQQTDTILTISQIPAHSHTARMAKETTGSGSSTIPARGKVDDPTSTITTSSVGGSQGHNHGKTWRPAANVGLLAVKTS